MIRGNDTTIAANSPTGTQSAISTATCPTGKVLLGGGVEVTNGGPGKQVAAVDLSAPTPRPATTGTTTTPTGWQGRAIVAVSNPGGETVTAFAVCSV